MKTTWVKLSDVCETTSGGTPLRSVPDYYGGDIPWVKSGELLDGWITDTEEKITKAGLASSSTKLFPAGTLLIALYGATVGRLGILGIDATTNQAVCGITPNEQLDRDFLFYYLLKQREKLIGSRTGGAQPNISQEIIRELDLPLPPLTEQKRIVSLLARADRLRHLRRTAHDLGESLLQSVFLEMFGDPLRNEKKWEEKNLKSLCRNITDGTHDTPDRTSSGIPFITSKNIRPYKIDLSVLEYVSEETHQEIIKRCNPQYGDVIYTNIGANLGNAAMNKLPFSFSLKNVALLQPDKKQLNSYYLEALLNNQRFRENLIYLSSAGGAQQFITLEILRTISIPYPPLSLQEEFASVVARVESMRSRQADSERQVNGLFESLLAESFS